MRTAPLVGTLLSAWLLSFAPAALALDFTVDTTSDEADAQPGDGICATRFGNCSLRAAIGELQQAPPGGAHTITFALPETQRRIQPQTQLPTLPPGTLLDGRNHGGDKLVTLDGRDQPQGVGLAAEGVGTVLSHIVVVGFPSYGVALAYEARLSDSFVGVEADGQSRNRNHEAGVIAFDDARIGACPSEAPCTYGGNQIYGNRLDGVEIQGSRVEVIANTFGVTKDNGQPLGNGRHGIFLPLLYQALQQGTVLRDNLLAHSGGAGIYIESASGLSPSRIPLWTNAFFGNRVGIGYSNLLWPTNDPGDSDVGPNTRLNAAVIDEAVFRSDCSLEVAGFTRPKTRVDFFLATDDDFPQGHLHLGTGTEASPSDSDSTSGSYNSEEHGADTTTRFRFTLPATGVDSPGARITAIATDTLSNSSYFSVPFAVNAGPNAFDDPDGDGLSTAYECLIGTNPTEADSDGDGVPDDLEIGDDFLFPRDTDRDGVIDALDPDDDGDGIPTLVELSFGPYTQDTDGDGIPDYRDSDADGDGIPDGLEGTDDVDGDSLPNFLDRDSDGDGFCDTPAAKWKPTRDLAVPFDCDGVGEDLNANGQQEVGETDPYDPQSYPGANGCVGPNGSGDLCACDGPSCQTCYADLDGDGFRGTALSIATNVSCDTVFAFGAPLSATGDNDCDDTRADIHPDAHERCDGIDNNCDGLIDNADPLVAYGDPSLSGAWPELFYEDLDRDGCGNPDAARYACSPLDEGFSDNGLDLDDSDGICCGNGILESGETCDNDAPRSCRDMGGFQPTSDLVLCEDCQWNTNACVASFCGDGHVDRDRGELCEPGDDPEAEVCALNASYVEVCGRCTSSCLIEPFPIEEPTEPTEPTEPNPEEPSPEEPSASSGGCSVEGNASWPFAAPILAGLLLLRLRRRGVRAASTHRT